MILYFRHSDGSISTRELGPPAGPVTLSVAPPAGAELIDAETGRAELDRLERIRQGKADHRRAELLAAKRAVHDELVALGVSATAAAALAGLPAPS